MDSAILFITELAYEQLKARGGVFDFLSIGSRNLNAKRLIHLSAESTNESYNIGKLCGCQIFHFGLSKNERKLETLIKSLNFNEHRDLLMHEHNPMP